jgi:predicted component of type VI protein secretion system
VLYLLAALVAVIIGLLALWLVERELHAGTRQDRDVALEFEYAERVRRQAAEDRLLAQSLAHAAQLERVLNQRSEDGHPRTHALHEVLGEEERL